ncbi:MAG: hypothetical protein IKX45_04585 [Bacteroidales bacterium]|nr:hypothetical protein [Bacteroidales bacterium]
MKNWEDIIKDKLEGYESPLPEGSLAEFRSRREASRAAAGARSEETAPRARSEEAAAGARSEETAPRARSEEAAAGARAGSAVSKKRSPLVWILPTAVAASLAAFLFLRQPGTPEGDGQNGWQPSTTIAVANTDSTDATEPIQPVQSAQSAQPVQTLQPAQPAQLIAQATTPKATQPAYSGTRGTESAGQQQAAETSEPSPEASATAMERPETNDAKADAAAAGTDKPAGPGQDGQIISPSQDGQAISPSQDGQALSPSQDGQAISPSQDGQAVSPSQDGQAISPSQNEQATNQPGPTNNQDTRTATTITFPTVELQKVGRDASYNYATLATIGGAAGAGLLTALATNIHFNNLPNSEPDGANEMRSAHAEYLRLLNYLEKMGIDTSDPAVLEDLFNNPLTGSWSPQKSLIEKLIELGIDPDDPAYLAFADYLNKKGNPTIPTNPSTNDAAHPDRLLKTTHRMPLTVGLSVRTPVSEKLYLTTGLEYSRYTSVYSYSKAGDIKQFDHFVGIPLRLDWVFASSKMFDLYAGAGLKAEWCWTGSEGFSTSLLGAGGVQFNLTDWLGIYVEPRLSWKMTLNEPVLETYRSEHPLMFAVATGIRFTIN